MIYFQKRRNKNFVSLSLSPEYLTSAADTPSHSFSPCCLSLVLCPSQLGLSQEASGWLHGMCPIILKLVSNISDPQQLEQCVCGGKWGVWGEGEKG